MSPTRVHPIPEDVIASGDFYVSVRTEGEHFGCLDNREPSDYLHEVKGTIVLEDSAGLPLATIGTFRIYVADVDGALTERVSTFDVFDTTAETFSFFEHLYAEPYTFKERVLKVAGMEDEFVSPGVLIFSRLEVQPEYRGKFYGLQAMRAIIQRYRVGVGMVIMKPFPLQFENREDGTAAPSPFSGSFDQCVRKLRRYYARLGFARLPRTEVMVLPTGRPLPQLSDPND